MDERVIFFALDPLRLDDDFVCFFSIQFSVVQCMPPIDQLTKKFRWSLSGEKLSKEKSNGSDFAIHRAQWAAL